MDKQIFELIPPFGGHDSPYDYLEHTYRGFAHFVTKESEEAFKLNYLVIAKC